MIAEMKQRVAGLQRRLQDAGIDLAVLTDEDSIAYYAGFWGYLGVEFGRPTFLLVPRDGAPTVITPLMESEMVGDMTWVEDIRPWQDDGADRWDGSGRSPPRMGPSRSSFTWTSWRPACSGSPSTARPTHSRCFRVASPDDHSVTCWTTSTWSYACRTSST